MKFCENSTFFCILNCISEKIKWKSVLATKKYVFQGANTETVFPKHLGWGETIKTHKILRKQHLFPFLGYVSYIFPISAFLSKCPAGKKIRWNFYENQTQKQTFGGNCCENRTKIKHKKQIFGENCCENRTLKKKHFLIFARFS